MGKMSRTKGKVGEREVAAMLRDHGFNGARGQQFRGGADSADVTGLPGYHIEVKRAEKLSLYDALQQAREDSAGQGLPVVFHRKNGTEWVAITTANIFLKLVRDAHGVG